MARSPIPGRRRFLTRGLAAAALGTLASARPATDQAAEAPLLDPKDPTAKQVQYTENASAVKGIPAGNTCANCALFQGTYTSAAGPCQLFPGKQVKAAGWCSSWAAQM